MIVSNFPQSGSEAQSGGFVQVTGTSVAKTETCYLTLTTSAPAESQSNIFGGSYGNGIIAYGGESGACYYSTNGTSWSKSTILSGYNVGKIAFLNNQFIAFLENGAVYTSSNATSWTKKGTAPVSPGSKHAYCADMVYFNGKYVVNYYKTGAGSIVTSPDLVTWTVLSITQGISEHSRFFVEGNTLYVTGSDGKALYSTTDLSTWTLKYTFSVSGVSICKPKDKYIAIGAGKIFTSTNLTAWIAYNTPLDVMTLGVFYKDGAYCVFDTAKFAYKTTDFTNYEVIVGGEDSGLLYTTAYDEPLYVEDLNAIFLNLYAESIYKYTFETNYKTTFSIGIDNPIKGQVINLLPSFTSSSKHDDFYIAHNGGSYKVMGKILKNVPNIIGKAKVQNISILFLKRVFRAYSKLCINISHEVPFLLILRIHH